MAQADQEGLLENPALDAATTMVSENRSNAWRLSPGMRLGPYEIAAAIGAGGMAEVYKARDTKLQRDVALKVLPENFAEDRERIARLYREAQLLASLNHPGIAAIYGLEEHEGICGLALEFVDGETLAERITRGPLRLDEALHLARHIADALGAAHAKGVVHRDLKPANIKITNEGVVKVLDFGLAKIFHPQQSLANIPRAAVNVSTDRNIILGTAAYMSPEQACGKDVDKRADIWAWGCVLYEMITGGRAFDGDTTVEMLNSVLNAPPDWNALPEPTPPIVRSLLRRCLQKDPHRRLQDIGDARIEIDEAMDQPATAAATRMPRRTPGYLGWATALVATLVALASLYFRPSPVHPSETRLHILTPGGDTPAVDRTGIAISPDGRKVVFLATTDGKRRLWLRSLESEQAKLLEDTAGAGPPFWSPNSQSVGFASRNDATGGFSLKSIDVAGGTARTWRPLKASLVVRGAVMAQSYSAPVDRAVRFSAFGAGPRALVSSNGGVNPKWNLDGGEIFYRDLGSRVMAVRVTLGANGTVDVATPKALFPLTSTAQFADVSLDGQRFLLNVPLEEPHPSPITVILNWTGLHREIRVVLISSTGMFYRKGLL